VTARLLSVNVGRPVQLAVRRGRPLMSAIGKAPVEGPVRVAGVNLEGDDQADRRVHGGPDKAVYAYAREDAEFWEGELGRALRPGAFGENLTT
jgi:MOSC domain-containing protein YiiM